jgi:virulence factor Mce-like protein
MRRAFVIAVVLAAASWLVVAGTGAGVETSKRYWVELDNAFGMVNGADVKIAGVRAGKIKQLKLDRRTYRARVEIQVDQPGFGDLRTDAFCETRPQSLIGEYFLDCQPGTSARRLPPGGTIGVQHTGSTVPVDLVSAIMRRPFRERFTLILNELGATLAARGGDLNETIRRASPALRETDRVLATLASQRRVLRALYKDADSVLRRVADNRGDVARFVAEARDTTGIQASRAREVRAQFERFPTFLRELRPTLAKLGAAAGEQEPLLQNLDRNAQRLKGLFDALGPFAQASRPSLRTLAAAAREGGPAVRAGSPNIVELGRFARRAPELTTNLAMVLEHLDDRRFATEKDKRSPGGQGYTGFEAFLRYIFSQSQAINLYDANSQILKVSAFLDRTCADWTTAALAREPARARCHAWLGPTQPGVNAPDPTVTQTTTASRSAAGYPDAVRLAQEALTDAPATGAADAPAAGGPAQPSAPSVRDLLDYLLAP